MFGLKKPDETDGRIYIVLYDTKISKVDNKNIHFSGNSYTRGVSAINASTVISDISNFSVTSTESTGTPPPSRSSRKSRPRYILSIYLPVYLLLIDLSIYLSSYRSIYLSNYPTPSSRKSRPWYPSIYVSIYLSIQHCSFQTYPIIQSFVSLLPVGIEIDNFNKSILNYIFIYSIHIIVCLL